MLNKKIFGTDGVRSRANGEFMNPFFINKFAFAIYKILLRNYHGEDKIKVIIAKDTRQSGYMLENALSSVLMSLGINVVLVGPIPTPAIPFLISSRKAKLGLMLSASHNPHYDNGIKIFDCNGFKISDELELEIEKIILDDDQYLYKNFSQSLAEPEKIGAMSRIHNTGEQYIDFLLKKLDRIDLQNIKIVIDCANGASYKTANIFFSKLNARIILINNKPNGLNINENCGAMCTDGLCEVVKKYKADFGIAFDGDADRILLCDENGVIIDNDKLMAIIAVEYKNNNKLNNNTVVTTILSNNGLEYFLNRHNIKVHKTGVGDKYINEAMRSFKYNFGGEKSGHIIFGDYSSSGDGVLCGVIIANIIVKSGLKASKVFEKVELFPQVMRNLNYNNLDILNSEVLREKIIHCEKTLGVGGRILVRKSGTERKIRLMAEGCDLIQINHILDSLTNFLNEVV